MKLRNCIVWKWVSCRRCIISVLFVYCPISSFSSIWYSWYSIQIYFEFDWIAVPENETSLVVLFDRTIATPCVLTNNQVSFECSSSHASNVIVSRKNDVLFVALNIVCFLFVLSYRFGWISCCFVKQCWFTKHLTVLSIVFYVPSCILAINLCRNAILFLLQRLFFLHWLVIVCYV